MVRRNASLRVSICFSSRKLCFEKHWARHTAAVIPSAPCLMPWKGHGGLPEQRMEPGVGTCHFVVN